MTAVGTQALSVQVLFGAACITVTLLASMRGAQAQKSSYFGNIPGDYCRTRGDPCCRQRQDDCSVPIMGTLCYCDEFCDRDDNPDCCPDYAPVCLGVKPPGKPPAEITIDCLYKNVHPMRHGDSIQDNCNSCTCKEDNTLMCSSYACLVDPDLLQQLPQGDGYGGAGAGQWDWTATNYSMFWGKQLQDGIIKRTGSRDFPTRLYPIYLDYDPTTIPREFDARTKWPFMISRPRDQGWCGSSWAISATTVATDRFTIETGGTEAVALSPQHLISCDRMAKQSCDGGSVVRAWQYLWRHGVVDEQCFPYTSGSTGIKGQCRVPRGSDYTSLQCNVSEHVNAERRSLFRTEPAYRIKGSETDIQYEIMTNGPVQAMMRVSPDFFYYRRGVYSSTGLSQHQQRGLHSVRLIGWGEQATNYISGPIKYWLAVNSWGTEWGEEGLFRILRGVNESGIEENILTVRGGLLTRYHSSQAVQSDPVWFFPGS